MFKNLQNVYKTSTISSLNSKLQLFYPKINPVSLKISDQASLKILNSSTAVSLILQAEGGLLKLLSTLLAELPTFWQILHTFYSRLSASQL